MWMVRLFLLLGLNVSTMELEDQITIIVREAIIL